MRVLRLAGVPGVGKSTVAWALAVALGADAPGPAVVAFVDVDQLGMSYPAPPADPERWELKERALAAVADVHAAAGTTLLVVSGVASPDGPPPLVPGHPTAVLWLDASSSVRAERLGVRGWSADRVAEVVATGSAEAARLPVGWTRLDTEQDSVETTVARVRELLPTASWAVAGGSRSGSDTPSTAAPDAPGAGSLLWLTGPRCCGASTVGWRIAAGQWRRGRPCVFADVAQLGFRWGSGPPAPIGSAVLRALLAVTSGSGVAPDAVVVAPLDAAPLDPVAGYAAPSVVRLDADPSTIRRRAASRTTGDGPVLAGDDLVGADTAVLEAVVATADGQRTRPLRPGERVVPTDGLDADAVVRLVLAGR